MRLFALGTSGDGGSAMFDVLLTGGRIIDGSGGAARYEDIAINGDRLVCGAAAQGAKAKKRIDVDGLVVAPGFIDVHTHSDGWLLKVNNWDIKLRQGFTTEVLMADGISYAPVTTSNTTEWMHYLRSLNGLEQGDYRGWRSCSEYMALLDRTCLQNTAHHVPYANVRTAICGFGEKQPSAQQLQSIQEMLREELAQGAVGLSTGLEYLDESLASTEELIAACRSFSNTKALHVTHIRYPLGLLEGLKEAVAISEQAGVRLHVSHLKAANPELAEQLLHYIDNEARQRVDFSFDVYPYAAASTMLHYLLPYSIWTDGPSGVVSKLHVAQVASHLAKELAAVDLSQTYIAWLESEQNKEWIGHSFEEFLRSRNCTPEAAAVALLIEENLSVLLVFRRGSDEIVFPFLQHECFMLGSDGVYFPEAKVHPRCYGSSARLLGSCVRRQQLFTLEQAVMKMTSIPAKRFGLQQRGELANEYFADVVVFDPEKISDTASYQDPAQLPTGITHVLVNGQVLIEEGMLVAEPSKAGRALQSSLFA